MATKIEIVDIITLDRITLQNVPKEMKHNPKTKHHVIRAMGANNPKYHYTGAEDILSCSTTLYCNNESRADVVETCRKLEALSKNDGFQGEKHELLLMWGSSLYQNHRWLLLEMEYIFRNFDGNQDGFPMGASIKLVFARITSANLTHEEIRTTSRPYNR